MTRLTRIHVSECPPSLDPPRTLPGTEGRHQRRHSISAVTAAQHIEDTIMSMEKVLKQEEDYKNPDLRRKNAERYRQAFQEFCMNTTFHGLRQISESQHYFVRRFIWVVLVLTGLSLFLYQMTAGIIYYLSRPTTVNVNIVYNDSIMVPALTLCNQNAFRKTKAVEYGLYVTLADMFTSSPADAHAHHKRDVTSIGDITEYDVYNMTGHSIDDLIISCSWDGTPCDVEDFVMTMTDYGKCYTFNSVRQHYATRTGTAGGLQLLLNVEQYEYMPGPNQGAGLRVLVHHKDDVALVREFGVSVPPGSHSLLGTSLIKITNLPLPHGSCVDNHDLQYHAHYSKHNCVEDCKQRVMEERCLCITKSMVANGEMGETLGWFVTLDSSSRCTLWQRLCVKEALDFFNKGPSKECYCPVPCKYDTYHIVNSYGDISHFDALNLLNSELTQQFQPTFAHSQEIDQRVSSKINEHDIQLVANFEKYFMEVNAAFVDIFANIEKAEAELEHMLEKLNNRVLFHKTKGLERVLFTMEHSFVRGWTVLEERTLPFLCQNFYELRAMFRRVIQNMDKAFASGNDQDQVVSLSLWQQLKYSFSEKLDVANRTISNISVVHDHYKSGEPLINYESSFNRRYDRTWISVDLLQAAVNNDTHNQDVFYDTIMETVDKIVDVLKTYIEMGTNFTDTQQVDKALWEATDEEYLASCSTYNFHTFLYKSRIIKGPVIIAKDKISVFEQLQRSLDDAKSNLFFMVEELKEYLEHFLEGSTWNALKLAIQSANNYLNISNSTKAHLAKTILSNNLASSLEYFFLEARAHSHELHESIEGLAVAINNIWENMLSEYTTQTFYDKVHADFELHRDNGSVDMSTYFADLLDTSVSFIQSTSLEELEYRLNADISNLSLDDKLEEIEEFFHDVEGLIDVGDVLGVSDAHLIDAMKQFWNSLETFKENLEIDTSFYMKNFIQLDIYVLDLNYEEIVQQPAYDMLNLLGDIGGSIGLFLGASALTVAEFLDLVVMQIVRARKLS